MEDEWDLAESRSGFAYNDIIQHWILEVKFFGQEHLSPLLGRLLALSFQNSTWLDKYDSIVPIPLHSSRLRKRGFNQSLLLAYHLRKNLRKNSPEIHPDWLRRTRATLPQIELPLAERKTNLEDAFSALADVRDKNILSLDDVMTSCSRLNAAEPCFKEAGAGKVGALVLCRKMRDSQN